MASPIDALLVALVVGVTDGDTLTALSEQREQIKIRIAEIDAPESRQPFGAASKRSLSDLCFKVRAEIRPQKTDRYGRTVARVTCRGEDASAHQVRTGMAWVFERYASDRSLFRLQDDAKAAGRGLWSERTPVPPWEWRKAR
ncbi:thermonuclease family protein [Methyloversatilis sp.]|uniref:thermonuclease family protein n=1 Tax=Methyloversatilis sp. TaxID=2569862 RepID=UPI003D27AC3B